MEDEARFRSLATRDLLNPESVGYFDFEDPTDLSRLDEPMTALAELRGLVVIDEVQRRETILQDVFREAIRSITHGLRWQGRAMYTYRNALVHRAGKQSGTALTTWNEGDKILPDYRERKEWLRKNRAGLAV